MCSCDEAADLLARLLNSEIAPNQLEKHMDVNHDVYYRGVKGILSTS